MLDKDPTSYSYITYVWVFAISIWGGLVNFIQKTKVKKPFTFNIAELIGELVISTGVGLVTFYLCEAAELSQLLSACFIAISSHMGTRAIFLFEEKLTKILNTLMKLP